MVEIANQVLRGSTASFVRLARHHASRRLAWRSHVRWQSAITAGAAKPESIKGRQQNLNVSSQSRYNDIGVQHLSAHVYKQIFPDGNTPPPPELVELAREHLRRHDLLGKNTDDNEPIARSIQNTTTSSSCQDSTDNHIQHHKN